MSITSLPWVWNLIVGFKECNESLILVNYGHNPMVGFRERQGQSLVDVSQTRSNLINGPKTTWLFEIHIRISIIGIEKYCDILVLSKFENNWMITLSKHSHKCT